MWRPTQRIVNFSSGVPATDEMRDDSLGVKQHGAVARDDSIEALTSENKKEAYYGPIKRQQIKLFSKN